MKCVDNRKENGLNKFTDDAQRKQEEGLHFQELLIAASN